MPMYELYTSGLAPYFHFPSVLRSPALQMRLTSAEKRGRTISTNLLARLFLMQSRRLISLLLACISAIWSVHCPPGPAVLLLQSCFLIGQAQVCAGAMGSCMELFLSLEPSAILITLTICNHLNAEIKSSMLNSTLLFSQL